MFGSFLIYFDEMIVVIEGDIIGTSNMLHCDDRSINEVLLR